VEPLAPVEPVVPGDPVAPVGPVGPGTGVGTGTTTGGVTTTGFSQALKASAVSTAETMILYFMGIPFVCGKNDLRVKFGVHSILLLDSKLQGHLVPFDSAHNPVVCWVTWPSLSHFNVFSGVSCSYVRWRTERAIRRVNTSLLLASSSKVIGA
jgi:hypothetical protein